MERHHCLKFFPITTKSTIQPKKWRTHSLIFSSEITSQLFNEQYGVHTWEILLWIFCNTKAFSQLVWPKFAILFKKNFCSLNGKLTAYSKFPSLLYVTNLSSYMTHTQSNFFWKALCNLASQRNIWPRNGPPWLLMTPILYYWISFFTRDVCKKTDLNILRIDWAMVILKSENKSQHLKKNW